MRTGHDSISEGISGDLILLIDKKKSINKEKKDPPILVSICPMLFYDKLI